MRKGNLLRGGIAAAALAGGIAGLSARADAAAFYIQEQSTKAIGRAFSGEVSERGAQQMWWNPASIGGITGIQQYAGFTAILPKGRVVNNGTTVGYPTFTGTNNVPVTGNNDVHSPIDKGYLPNGGFAIPLGDKFAFGLTVTSPFSFTTNYDADAWTRYAADKSRLRTFDIQPAIAFSPNEHISFGAAPNIEYTRATLSNKLPDPVSLSNPDGKQFLKGDGWDVGYSFGFQYHNDKVDIGASYKSSVKHHLKGRLVVNGLDPTKDPLAALINTRIDGAKANFSTPWQVNLGMRYHVSPKLTVEGQVTRYGWDKFYSIDLVNLPASLGNPTVVENYHNTFAYALGFDYQLNPKLTWRAGVQRDLSPIPNDARDPRVPDGPRWNFATGGSYEMTEHMGLDLGASYVKIHSVPINKLVADYDGTIVQRNVALNGRLEGAHAVVLSLGGHLDF